ncbi:MAG: hypothetical protein LBL45_11280 [Treponema sp.]|jgi:hypothetical protein|nr:hypothetical protein [Treponema sp.]
MNKKIWVIAIFLVIIAGSVSVYAQNLILRQQQTLEGGGGSLKLYPSGRMVFYFNYQTYEGKYSISDGYLNLYETDGTKLGSFPFEWAIKNRSISWVDVGGTKLYR